MTDGMQMNKYGWLAATAVALAVTAALVLPAQAMAADHTNTDCLTCHTLAMWDMSFEAGTVDRDTACRKCHLDTLAGTHPFHNATSNCGAVCHPGWGTSLLANTPTNVYSGGSFASPTSQDTPSSLLHIIHSNPRWPAGVSTEREKCGSCHAVAACTACHDGGALHTSHSDHAAGSGAMVKPWVGDLSPGVLGNDMSMDTKHRNTSLRCGASECHDIIGVGDLAPVYQDNYTHPAYPNLGWVAHTVTTSGAWTTQYGSVYTGGQQLLSNTTGRWWQTTFSGQRVQLVSTVDPYRGRARIEIDAGTPDAITAEVDMYAPGTRYQVPVWTSPELSEGSHTIRITVLGTKQAAAKSTHACIDQLRIYLNSPDVRAPWCGGCHPGQSTDAHGGQIGVTPTFTHEATQTAGVLDDTGFGNYRCDSCHLMKFGDEHNRATSSSAGRSCGNCHTTYAPYEWTGTWSPASGCGYAGCHTAAPRLRHGNVVAAHSAPATGQNPVCINCHGGDVRAAHANSIPGNGYLETNGCLACHGTTKFPTTASCTAAGCHPASGVSSLVSHGFNTTKHTAATFTRAAQGTGAKGAVDDGGRECAVCHSSRLDAAHSDSPAVGCATGGANGLGCHLDTERGSMAVQAAGWPSGKCVECHDHGAYSTHDTVGTSHLVLPGAGCAGTGSGCHASLDLREIHESSQSGGPRNHQGCTNRDLGDPYGCHSVVDRRPTANMSNSCGSTSTGCHSDVSLATHPGALDHGFTTASYYSSTTETGCTNQPGCHNATGAQTTDFAASYHPNSGCTEGPCHASPSQPDPAFDRPVDCMSCHDGQYIGSPDVISLRDVHYSPTVHDATGLSTVLRAGGSAGAACADCHNPAVGSLAAGLLNQHSSISIAGSPYGLSLACGECHGDLRNNGNAEVTAKWPSRNCEGCHKLGGSSPLSHAANVPVVAATGPAGCGSTGVNCHSVNDLHVIHKDSSAGCDQPGCHDFSQQAYKPTTTSCGTGGACHSTYTKDSYSHTADTAKHAPTTTTQADVSTFYGTACGSCHDIRTGVASLYNEHSRTTSAKTTSASNVCLNCHNNPAATTAITGGWSARDTASACAACHAGGAMAIHSDNNPAAHSTAANTGCANSGVGCHNGANIGTAGVPAYGNSVIHTSCLRCHDRTGAESWSSAMIGSGSNMRYNPATKTCGQATGCHTSGSYSATAHRIGRGDAVTGNDTKHTATSGMGSTLSVGSASASCAACHSATLASAHATPLTGWASACGSCHNSTLGGSVSPRTVKADWPTKSCLECHAAGAPADKVGGWHAAYGTTAHVASSPLGCGNTGIGCHTSTDLAQLHSKRTNGCQLAGCHDAVDKPMALASKSCGQGGGCHTGYTLTSHGTANGNDAKHTATGMTTLVGTEYNAGRTCAQCHVGTLLSAHTGTAASTCSDCHGATSPINANKVIKTDGWNATCAQCHGAPNGPALHNTYTTGHQGVPPAGSTCLEGCHTGRDSTDLREVHKLAGCAIAGCHTAVGDSPSVKTCVTCHPGYADGNHSAASFTSHSATNPSTLSNCGRCHSDDNARAGMQITETKDGGTTVPSTMHANVDRGGRGCATCHAADSRVFNPVGTRTADCFSCHVDHYRYVENLTPYNTTSTSTGNLAKTLTMDMTGLTYLDVEANLGTASNAVPANIRVEVGPGGAGYTFTDSTTAMDPNRKSFAWRNINVSALNGVQQVRLYVWRNAGTSTPVYNEEFTAAASRNTLAYKHTADVAGFSCGFGDCHEANVISEHAKYQVPTSQGIVYDVVAEDNTEVNTQGLTATLMKTAANVDLAGKESMRINANLRADNSTPRMRIDVVVGGQVIWTRDYTTASTTYQNVAANEIIDISGQNGTADVNLYLWRDSGGGTRRAWNSSFRVETGAEVITYEPIDTCDLCHLSTVRRDPQGHTNQPAGYELDLTPYTPSLAGIGVQCDTCHPNYEDVHSSFSHAATAASDGCLGACHGQRPAIGGTPLANSRDLLLQHQWGDNDGTGGKNSGTMEGGCASGPGGSCHNQGRPTTGECADCHTSVNHHKESHNLVNAFDGWAGHSIWPSSPIDSSFGLNTGVKIGGRNASPCVVGCHSYYLDATHGTTLANPTGGRPYKAPTASDVSPKDGNMSCLTCHGTESIKQVKAKVDGKGPIERGVLRCTDCHNGTIANQPHSGGAAATRRTGSPLVGSNLYSEFNNATSVSGHRAGPFTTAAQNTYYFSTTGWFTASGTGRTAFNFNAITNSMLRANTVSASGGAGDPLKMSGNTTLSRTTNLHCADCHDDTVMNGPQGAATSIGMYPGFTARYQSNNVVPPPNNMICSRCHAFPTTAPAGSLKAANGGHWKNGVYCTNCHIGIPHAWKRPKLLVRYGTDPAPYAWPGTEGLRGWNGGSGTGSATNTWGSSGNCTATGCKAHSSGNTVP